MQIPAAAAAEVPLNGRQPSDGRIHHISADKSRALPEVVRQCRSTARAEPAATPSAGQIWITHDHVTQVLELDGPTKHHNSIR